jgi:rare lipoprotein A (peptidoglycan hydrolase)
VTASAGRRAASLAAVALVAIAVALAVSHRSRHTSTLPAAAGDWYTALAAPYTPSAKQPKSACGVAIAANTIGVAHPVLPCGVKLYVEYRGKQVLTQVIDRGHTVPGREFDLTQALAKLLHVEGTQTIQWRFAR